MKWFGIESVTFWQPITAPTLKWWRDLHIRAHVIGGVVWDIVFRFLLIGGSSVWVDFRHSPLLRLAGVGLVQLTLWEMIQKENWRPELMPTAPKNNGYPWLSAIWDVIFTVLGAVIAEIVLGLIAVFIAFKVFGIL